MPARGLHLGRHDCHRDSLEPVLAVSCQDLRELNLFFRQIRFALRE
jgi:hypothetical protein